MIYLFMILQVLIPLWAPFWQALKVQTAAHLGYWSNPGQ